MLKIITLNTYKLTNMFCKNLLVVLIQTCNQGTPFELGQIPFNQNRWHKNCGRVKEFDANLLVKTHTEMLFGKNWFYRNRHVKYFCKNVMLDLYECTITYTRHPTKFKEVFQLLVDQFDQETFLWN